MASCLLRALTRHLMYVIDLLIQVKIVNYSLSFEKPRRVDLCPPATRGSTSNYGLYVLYSPRWPNCRRRACPRSLLTASASDNPKTMTCNPTMLTQSPPRRRQLQCQQRVRMEVRNREGRRAPLNPPYYAGTRPRTSSNRQSPGPSISSTSLNCTVH